MKSFGDGLKKAREERGVTLDTIAHDTRISKRYLLALEQSDLETLPGRAFEQGYIRAYAQCLGIDAAPILEDYADLERRIGRRTEERAQRELQELSRLLDRRSPTRGSISIVFRKWTLLAAASAVLALVAASFWMMGSKDVPSARPIEPPVTPAVDQEPIVPAPTRSTNPPPQPEEPTRPPTETAGVTIPNYGVGTAVVDHQLVGRSDGFAEGTEVVFWTRVVGGKAGQEIRHIWTHEGKLAMESKLRLGGPHWRTFSRLTLPPGSAGNWSIEAQTSDGRTLARQEFRCIE